MGIVTKRGRLACLLSLGLLLSCAQDDSAVFADVQWRLSCPAGGDLGCGSWATDSCIGEGTQRAIVGAHGQAECDDQIIAICESVTRTGGTEDDITIEVNVDRGGGSSPRFALELSAKIDRADDSVEFCNVTVIEDDVPYDIGECGEDPPAMPQQPCQLTDISTGGNEVSFNLSCKSLISSVTGSALDVDSTSPIRFSNCTGF